MLNRTRKHKIWYYFLTVAVIAAGVFTLSFVQSRAKQISYMSSVSWLRTTILDELNGYYAKHKEYPETLHDLSISFPGDNATPDMLKLFVYTSDGNSFRLVLETGSEKGYRYEYIGTRGETVRFNEYVGETLVKSADHNDLSAYNLKF